MEYSDFLLLRDVLETESCDGDTSALVAAGYLNESGITEKGLAAMQPFRVKRAVFTAAGLGSRAVPLTYDVPKGMIDVHGEYMIERQIKQLLQAGIDEIWMVVGHMHEGYRWLGGKYGVRFLTNPVYNTMNTIGSVFHALDLFNDNLYLLMTDIYLERNIFHSYEYRSWYAAPFAGGETPEWCFTLDKDDLITHVEIGGADAHIMRGPVYMDAAFARQLAELIPGYVADPSKYYMYWEHIFMERIAEMPMYAYRMIDTSMEFETVEELRQWDSRYIADSGNRHMQAMAEALGICEADIGGIRPLPDGLFTRRFSFTANGEYMHFYYDADVIPLLGMEGDCMQALGIPGTFIMKSIMQPVQDDALAMAALRSFHESHTSEKLPDTGREVMAQGPPAMWDIDSIYLGSNGGEPASLLQRFKGNIPIMGCFNFVADEELQALDSTPERDWVLTHGAFCSRNCLVAGGSTKLVENAFSCMGDRLSDVGFYCACDGKDIQPLLTAYLKRQPDAEQLERCRRYAASTALALFSRYSELSRSGIDCRDKPQFYLSLINKYS